MNAFERPYIELGFAKEEDGGPGEMPDSEFSEWFAEFQKRATLDRLRSVDRHNKVMRNSARYKRLRRTALIPAVIGAVLLITGLTHPHPYDPWYLVKMVAGVALFLPVFATWAVD